MNLDQKLISTFAVQSDLVYSGIYGFGLYASNQEDVGLTPFINKFAELITEHVLKTVTEGDV